MTTSEFPSASAGGRVDPPYAAGEREMLLAWLDYHRATLLMKCSGLTPEQLVSRSVPPSSLSLLGLVRHMTEVERYWFRAVLLGEPLAPLYWSDSAEDGDFDAVDPATAEEDLARFLAEVDASRAASEGWDDLDAVGRGLRRGEPVSLRWILVHMVEEYARHNGHADLLRERLDGATGD